MPSRLSHAVFASPFLLFYCMYSTVLGFTSLKYLSGLLLSIYSSQMALVISPAISTLATKSPNFPLFTSLCTITTLLSLCNPTAANVPALFTENCLGNLPPDGASCTNESFPVASSMAQLCSVSEGILVLLVGSKLSIWKRVALREDVRRNLWSGFWNVSLYYKEGWEGRRTLIIASAAAAPTGVAVGPYVPLTNTCSNPRLFSSYVTL